MSRKEGTEISPPRKEAIPQPFGLLARDSSDHTAFTRNIRKSAADEALNYDSSYVEIYVCSALDQKNSDKGAANQAKRALRKRRYLLHASSYRLYPVSANNCGISAKCY